MTSICPLKQDPMEQNLFSNKKWNQIEVSHYQIDKFVRRVIKKLREDILNISKLNIKGRL